MARMSIGSDYWESRFGISSPEELADEVSAFMPHLGIPFVFLSPEQVTRVAYESPFGGIGLLASNILSVKRLINPDPVALSAIGSASNDYLVRGQQAGATNPYGVGMTLILADCFLCSIEGVSGGQPIVNVIGVKKSGGGGTAAAAAAAVLAAWKVATGPLVNLPSSYAMVQVRAIDLSSANGSIAAVTDTTVGSASATLATNAACALVKWNGGTRSRSSRGRLYFGPLSESHVNSDGRTVGSASVTAFGTAFTAFRNSLGTAGYPLVVISRKLSTSYDVTSHNVESVLGTQRRRIRN